MVYKFIIYDKSNNNKLDCIEAYSESSALSLYLIKQCISSRVIDDIVFEWREDILGGYWCPSTYATEHNLSVKKVVEIEKKEMR